MASRIRESVRMQNLLFHFNLSFYFHIEWSVGVPLLNHSLNEEIHKPIGVAPIQEKKQLQFGHVKHVRSDIICYTTSNLKVQNACKNI